MPEKTHITDTPDEASKGGIQAIVTFEGDLNTYERVDNIFGPEDMNGKPASDMIHMGFDDVVIIEMEPGEDEPELTDDHLDIHVNYAKPGKENAHKNSFWVKGVVQSTADMGTTPSKLVGSRVRMTKKTVVLFKRGSDEDAEEITGTNYVFCPSDGAGLDPDDVAREKLAGLNKAAALRVVAQNNVLKRDSKYKEAVMAGAPVAGMSLNEEGLYQIDNSS